MSNQNHEPDRKRIVAEMMAKLDDIERKIEESNRMLASQGISAEEVRRRLGPEMEKEAEAQAEALFRQDMAEIEAQTALAREQLNDPSVSAGVSEVAASVQQKRFQRMV